MGYTSYSTSERTLRSVNLGYETKSVNEIFVQNQKRMIHESMTPKTALLRESRDSAQHPNTVPIIIALDVTGSMGKIPHYMVKKGLPNIVEKLINSGIADPQILFLAIGDHECDTYPLQVGQFESGDLELDLWLTRTYIESGGGGNAGESYSLAWYYASKHTLIDSFEKRKQKGFLFTIGDEPALRTIPSNTIKDLFDTPSQKSYDVNELLDMASEKYNVFHLHIMEGSAGRNSIGFWENLLSQKCVRVDNHTDVDKKITELILSNVNVNNTNVNKKTEVKPEEKVNIIL
jgi:hypothetical protein